MTHAASVDASLVAVKSTYRAMQVSPSRALELVERQTPQPGDGEVLIAVQACGMCGADVSDIEGADLNLSLSRVPGHEVVGQIAAIGNHVSPQWTIGQRVGVGRLGGHCLECAQCRAGLFQLCRNQPFVGSSCDGGYAEMMLARATALVRIPDELHATEAAPILCAGIATFNALKKCGAQAGDLVAILGIGGLGHMAVQYARRMGFNVVAIGRGTDIAFDAIELGAHIYIDTDQDDAAARLQSMGGAVAMITTVGSGALVSSMAPGLAPAGCMVVLAPGKDPLSLPMGLLVGGERSIVGSITGSPFENEKALSFSVLTQSLPMIETMPLEHANIAYQKLKSGQVKFRMVLTVDQTNLAFLEYATL